MNFKDGLKDDESGVMVFALLAIVILLLSIVAGAYYANIKLERQEEVTDTARIREIEVRLKQIEGELENALWEAGQKAVEEVRSEILKTGIDYTLNELQFMVGENTTRIFQDYFKESYEEFSKIGGSEIHLHLRPLLEDGTDLEMIPLYINEVKGSESGRKEIPGFFRLERTVHADIKDEEASIFFSRKLMIGRTVKTNFFILAERMNEFTPSRLERMTNSMLFTYLHTRLYDDGEDFQGDWFKRSFKQTFNTEWLKEYDGTSGGFDGGERREDVWQKNNSDHLQGFVRDIGRFQRSDILTRDDVEGMAKLALLLEQIRVFRSYDEELLSDISSYFDLSEDALLDHLGDGLENKVNLESLIIKLYQEKGMLSDQVHYSGPFLNWILREDFLSIFEEDEEWIDTSFGILKRLIQGEMLGEGNGWRYRDLSDEITPLSALDEENSYLSALVSLHPKVMEETFESFRVDEVDEFVKEKIASLGTLKWMKETSVIGKEGVESVIDSVLYTAANLSVSFGFEDEDRSDLGSTFYYIYFLSDWGFQTSRGDKMEPYDRLNEDGMMSVIHGTIKNELKTREDDLRGEKRRRYEEVVKSITDYDEIKWYNGEDEKWRAIWDDLNKTKQVLEELGSNAVFNENRECNTTEVLEDEYKGLKEDIRTIKNATSWMDSDAEKYTWNILDLQKNFTSTKWQAEAYRHLIEEERKGVEGHIRYVDDFLNLPSSDLTGSYQWDLFNYSVTSDIDLPPRDFEESVGYASVGSFIEDLERDFSAPLNYSNSFKFFQRVNQNLFDLGGIRSGENEDKSRLESILLGEGDPYSESFNYSDDVKVPLDISEEDIHSSDLEEISTSWIDEGYSRTIEELENIKEVLGDRADELNKESLNEEPYQKYGLASFYRSSNTVLSPLIRTIDSYRRSTILRGDKVSYLYEIDGETKTLPVVSAPLGGLTVQDGEESEDGFSYTFDFDIEMSVDDGLIDPGRITSTTTRLYGDGATTSYEWANPFSEAYSSPYNTFLSTEFLTPDFDIEISSRSEYILSSEKYASAGYKRSYAPRKYALSTELLTPMPVLEEQYNPAPTEDIGLNNLSLHQNVFNASENQLELSFDIEYQRPTTFVVEVLKEDGTQGGSAVRRRKSNYYSAVDAVAGGGTVTELKREKVSLEGRRDDEPDVNISLSFKDEQFPEKGLERAQLILCIKPEISIGTMRKDQNLAQESDEPIGLYSLPPSISISEQIYLVERDKEAYIGIFNFSSGVDEGRRGEFDLVKNTPDESWIIEKDGIPFLVGIEDIPEYRDLITGRYEVGVSGKDREEDKELVDPFILLKEREASKYSLLPESDLRTVLENEFLSLFMAAASDEQNHFYPVRVLPGLEKDREGWTSLEDELEKGGYMIGNWRDIDLPGSSRSSGSRYLKRENMMEDLGIGVGGYLYYSLEAYHPSKRINHAFNSITSFGEDIEEITRRREETDLLIGTEEDFEIMREANLADEFLSSGREKREDIFLAACKLGNENETRVIEGLKGEFEDISKGYIGIGLSVLGEERTEEALEWFEINQNISTRNKEFGSFLSFNDSFLQGLRGEDYGEALTDLKKDMGSMNFTEAREFGVGNSEDLNSLEYLQEKYEKDDLLYIAGYGVSPTAVKEMDESHFKVELDDLVRWMGDFSCTHYFPNFVDELNAGEQYNIPSLSFAACSDHSSVEWMPFGEDGPHLLVGDDLIFYNRSLSRVFSEEGIKGLIDRTVEDASECFDEFNERGKIILELEADIELRTDQKEEIYSVMEKRAKEHSPGYHSIGSIELKSGSGTQVRYLHI